MEPWAWILVGVLGTGGIIYLLFVRTFNCLQCGAKMKIMNIDKCPTCKTYHIKKKNQIALVEKGTIEEGHHFAVRYAELTPDPALWIWPDECCICGALPEKYEELRLNLGQAQMAGLMTRVTFWNVPVPYCKSHKFGVRWNSDPSMNEPDDGRINGIALCFNSFDYMLHFKTLNSLR